MVLSFALATALLVSSEKQGIGLSALLSMRIKLENFVLFGAVVFGWQVIFTLCGFCQSEGIAKTASLYRDALKATTLSTLLLMLVAKWFNIKMVTSRFTLIFWLISSGLMIAALVVVHYVLGKIRKRGRDLRYVLIIGTNPRAIKFARTIESKPELGYRVLGFVDDEWSGLGAIRLTEYPLCTDCSGLAQFLRENVVDEVAIYLPLRTFYQYVSQAAALCEEHGIAVRFASDIVNMKIARPYADDLDGNAHITAYPGARDDWALLIKRGLDIIISFVLVILLGIPFVIVALLIKLTSAGPVFFQQERIGLNKRKFLIYKFRTMVPNAEKMLKELEILNEVSGPVFKIKNDPRMTPIGRILRRTSIDELPQLFNVLKGDMSLVGPRPLPVRDYEGFNEDWQRRRFSIRPGITCLWQVNGRNSISFEKWMRLDLQYMDEWSLWLDVKILARTVPAVLKGSGAA